MDNSREFQSAEVTDVAAALSFLSDLFPHVKKAEI